MKHSKEQTILINILTRTSNRPVGFRKSYTSIKEQTYKNIRHIVSFDDIADLWYLNDLDVSLVDVSKIKKVGDFMRADSEDGLYAPYNLYCDAMLEIVEEGWVLFLDDDDNLYHNRVIEEIVSKIKEMGDENSILIWQMRYPDGRLLPTNNQIKNQIIKKNNIGSPCFLFHSKYISRAHWDSFKGSDFRFLLQLLKYVPNQIFLQKVMIQINNYGDFGKRNDLSKPLASNFKMQKSFYKSTLWILIPKYHTKLLGISIFHKNTYKALFKKTFAKIKDISV